ncbi:MAG: hypothetical protein IPM29_15575 [Planctomycetes bacterium]|nr:hypothetical protein [Planctomycetota bacterium]
MIQQQGRRGLAFTALAAGGILAADAALRGRPLPWPALALLGIVTAIGLLWPRRKRC